MKVKFSNVSYRYNKNDMFALNNVNFTLDKNEIIFGCCRKDYASILNKIDTADCEIDTLSCQNLEL